MSTDLPARGPLTDLVIEHLTTQLDDLVGDGGVPPAAGWSGNQPGQGTFVASVTVTTGEGYPNSHLETMRSRHTSWRMVYGMKTIGGARMQADHVADRARAAALTIPRGEITLGGAQWSIQDVVLGRLAPVQKKDPTDAPTYEVDDSFEVWVTRQGR